MKSMLLSCGPLVLIVALCENHVFGVPYEHRGYGEEAIGGFAYQTYTVTNLDDYYEGGPIIAGSLRAAVRNALINGGGYIEFDTDGVIKLKQTLAIPSNVTIAGETANGPNGITLYGPIDEEREEPTVQVGSINWGLTSNVIIRHIRIRARDIDWTAGEDKNNADCLVLLDCKDVMVQRCSFAWASDEIVSVAEGQYITIEYCIIAECLRDHSMGAWMTGHYDQVSHITMHHNLFISNFDRNPLSTLYDPDGQNGPLQAKDSLPTKLEVYNNVVYNWGDHAFHTAYDYETHNNVVGNVFIPGPNTNKIYGLYRAAMVSKASHCYRHDNDLRDQSDFWFLPESFPCSSPCFTPSFTPESSSTAYSNVAWYVGPTRAFTDPAGIDGRLLDELESSKGSPPMQERDGSIKIDPWWWEEYVLENWGE